MLPLTAVVEGRSTAYTGNKLRADFPQLQLNSWKARLLQGLQLTQSLIEHTDPELPLVQVWPIISIAIYKYVPLKLRTLAVQLVALFW